MFRMIICPHKYCEQLLPFLHLMIMQRPVKTCFFVTGRVRYFFQHERGREYWKTSICQEKLFMQQKYLLESFIMKSRNLWFGNEMCQLSNPYLQFRYDLGSGLANITAPPLDGGGIKLNSWHHVTITRNGPHGTIQVIFLSCCNFVPTREHPQKI